MANSDPTSAQRCGDNPQSSPVKKPARNASPTPVGSLIAFSCATGTKMSNPSREVIRAPLFPMVVIRIPTWFKTSSADQPVRCSIKVASYSLLKRYSAPSITSTVCWLSRRGSCWDGSATNGIPNDLQATVCLRMASGSSAPIKTKSSPCTFSEIFVNSSSIDSLMAPG